MKFWKFGERIERIENLIEDIIGYVRSIDTQVNSIKGALVVAHELAVTERNRQDAVNRWLVVGLDHAGKPEHRYLGHKQVKNFFGERYAEALTHVDRAQLGEVLYIEDFMLVKIAVTRLEEPDTIRRYQL